MTEKPEPTIAELFAAHRARQAAGELSPLLRPLPPGEVASPLRRVADLIDKAEAGIYRIGLAANGAGYGLAAIRGHGDAMFERLRVELARS